MLSFLPNLSNRPIPVEKEITNGQTKRKQDEKVDRATEEHNAAQQNTRIFLKNTILPMHGFLQALALIFVHIRILYANTYLKFASVSGTRN